MVLQLGDKYFSVEDLDDEDVFWTVRRYANGELSAEDIATLSELPAEVVEGGLAALVEGGIAYDASAAQPDLLPATEVTAVVRRFGDMWRAHLFRHSVFNPEHASPLVWLGFLTENWHRAGWFPDIVRKAIVAAEGDAAVNAALAQLAEEEEDHARYYAEALAAFDIDAAHFLSASAALLSTRSLCWFLEELATKRPLSFLGVCRLTESEADDEHAFSDEAARIAHGYSVNVGAVSPIVEHGKLDAGASHKLLIDHVLGSQSEWPRALVESLLQDMHDFRHVYGQFLDGIEDHYGGPSDSIPNRVFRWSDFPR